MATPVIMPKFGMTQEEATIVRWYKEEGDTVVAGEPLLEVTTDKVNMDVEAPTSGILRGIAYGEGDTVQVTKTLAYLVAPDESWATPMEQPISEGSPAPGARSKATPVARRVAEAEGVDWRGISGTGPGGRITRADVERELAIRATGKVRATPAARRVAREKGIDLGGLVGTGPKGRIQEADVHVAARALPAQPAETVVPLTGMRGVIAQRISESYRTAPHIHLSLSVDTTAAEAARQMWAQRTEARISLTVIIVKACAWVLRHHPHVNATLDQAGLHLWEDINIGVAVAVPDGLIVPVIRQADRKPVEALAQELHDLAEKARQGRLRPQDVEGGTFTITNLGMFGIESFDPILNPPEVAILGVGAAIPTPVAQGEQVTIRPVMRLTLAADHRALDGVAAARFLQDVRAGIEEPILLLL